MDIIQLRILSKNDISHSAERLSPSDIDFLVATLAGKEDTIRYNAFLLLQANSRISSSVYEHWSGLEKKLESTNSYQRNIGLKLIAENVRWDKDGKFNKIISKYLMCCLDEKFITARQAIQGLAIILEATNAYDDKIRQGLTHLSLAKYKVHQQRLLNKDIADTLKIIEKRSAK